VEEWELPPLFYDSQKEYDMSNGKKLINELDYRERIQAMKPRELSVFTAMQVYESRMILTEHEVRLDNIETRLPIKPTKKKQATFTGSIFAFLSCLLYALGSRLGWWT